MWFRFLKAIRRREHRVAPTTWVVALAAVVYSIVPIDLIPELVLGPLGFADDVGVWAVFAVLFAREKRRWQASLASGKAARRQRADGGSPASAPPIAEMPGAKK